MHRNTLSLNILLNFYELIFEMKRGIVFFNKTFVLPYSEKDF